MCVCVMCCGTGCRNGTGQVQAVQAARVARTRCVCTQDRQYMQTVCLVQAVHPVQAVHTACMPSPVQVVSMRYACVL